MNIKFEQKDLEFLLIFDRTLRGDNSNLCVFNNLTVIEILSGKPWK